MFHLSFGFSGPFRASIAYYTCFKDVNWAQRDEGLAEVTVWAVCKAFSSTWVAWLPVPGTGVTPRNVKFQLALWSEQPLSPELTPQSGSRRPASLTPPGNPLSYRVWALPHPSWVRRSIYLTSPMLIKMWEVMAQRPEAMKFIDNEGKRWSEWLMTKIYVVSSPK